MGNHHWPLERVRTQARTYGPIIIAYLLLTAFTAANNPGDTIHYAEDILRSDLFFDFGHLLWRPVGYLLSILTGPLMRLFVHTEPSANIIRTLLAINWLAGLVCVCLIRSLAALLTQATKFAADAIAGGFLLSYAFLNFSQTGSAYVPGLVFLLLSMHLLLKHSINGKLRPRVVWKSGIILALGISFWSPYILAVPGILLSPLFFAGSQRRRAFRFVALGVLAFCLSIILIFGSVALSLGISSLPELTAWITAAAHNLPAQSGPLRMGVGLAKSFVYLGSFGTTIKRYLVHDPYNPVSIQDLIQFHSLKFLVFYGLALGMLIGLLRTPLRRSYLWLWVLGSLPTLVFGVFWIGGAADRYFPLYPITFLTTAFVWGQPRQKAWLKTAAVTLLAMMLYSNIAATAKPIINREERAAFSRIQGVVSLLGPKDKIIVVGPDSVHQFVFRFPLHPSNLKGQLHWRMFYDLADAQSNKDWLKALPDEVSVVWATGGDVWVSSRVLELRPKSEWNWVEGNVPGMRWKDIQEYFSCLEFEKLDGVSDGFMRLSHSTYNLQVLKISQALDNWH